ncbi:hypothetical protein [Bradyrhizobium sp. JR3.5]
MDRAIALVEVALEPGLQIAGECRPSVFNPMTRPNAPCSTTGRPYCLTRMEAA